MMKRQASNASPRCALVTATSTIWSAGASSPTRWTTSASRMSKRCARLGRRSRGAPSRSCPGSARASSWTRSRRSLTSRTVPMNDATAPTRRSLAAQCGDLAAGVEVLGRDADGHGALQPPVTGGAARPRRRRAARRAEPCEVVVHRDAKGASRRKLARARIAARAQLRREASSDASAPAASVTRSPAAAERLAQAREVDDVDGDADDGVMNRASDSRVNRLSRAYTRDTWPAKLV